MLTEEFKSYLNGLDNPCYVITKDFTIKYVNPAAVAFTPKGIPGAEFLRVLCGRNVPCTECPLNSEINDSKINVAEDSLCAFAKVTFTKCPCDDDYIVSSWNEQHSDPIRDIPEINLDKALENLNGLREAYDNVLEVFYQTGAEKPEVILDLYNRRDYHNLRIEVHGLKGTAYVIGAMHLGDFAKKLEFACRDIEDNADPGTVAASKQCIDDELNDLIAEYVDLLGKLSNVFGPYETANEVLEIPAPPTDDEIANHLNKALGLLESFELEDAQNHLELAEEKMSDDLSKNYLNEVLRLLGDFNYDEAAETLRKWIK